MKTLFFPIIVILTCLSARPVCAETQHRPPPTIIVAGDHYYPPYEFLDDQGRPTGYNVDVTRAIAKVMGIKVTIRLGNWDKMRKALEKGEVDALEGIVFSQERQEKYDFTPAHAIIHQSIFHRKNTAPVQNIDDLTGKEVIIQKGGSIHDYFLNKHLDATLILTDTHVSALRLLAAGEHDYAVAANLPGQFLGKKFGLSNLVMSGVPIQSFKYCYAVKKGNVELLALLNEGLSILKNTGRHKQIYDKWFRAYEPKPFPWKLIVKTSLIIVLPLVMMMAGVVLWNRSLKKEVNIRTHEIYQQQQQLIQADKLSTLGILASGVAHEINNPNSLVLLNTSIIEDALKDMIPVTDEYFREHPDFSPAGLDYDRIREELPQMVLEMQAGARRIKRIVEDLKDYSRIERAGDMALSDINNIIDTSIRLADTSIKKATNHFAFIPGKNLKHVLCNSQRIEQVLVNLILNACQALTCRSNAITIKSCASLDKKFVEIVITDQGTGIEPEHLGHLTDPFFTTKRNCGGTGLGLSVSSSIIKEHNGTLTFESDPGNCTTVRISLPVQE